MSDYKNTPDKITYFAETDYRSKRIKFGIRDEDRARHMYVIGKTGMGKSTLLENLAIQDIQNGEGVCFIDPHGGTAETLLSYVPEHRIKDVIYFAPFDQEFPVGLNVMEDMGRDKRPLVVSGLMGAFKKVWVDAWSARMEYILNNAMLALMESPGSTLLGVNRMFADKDYRNMIVANVTDPSVKAFWLDEYAKYSDKFATEATAAIQNKVGQFAANPLIRNLVGQPKSTFDIRDIMDNRKIFIVNLSKGRMGEGNANLVGSMLITKIYLAAMSRADVGPETVKSLPSFYLYVDEFQSFANESFADILSEARKYKLALTIAHQYIEQMSDEVRAAVFGNVGTMVSFRVGSYDADVLEKEFAPLFLAEDMVNLGFAQVYMKLMIRGIGSSPFSATTLNRPAFPARNYAKEVIDSSHTQFALPRAQVEEDIRKWHEPVVVPPRDPNASGPPETKKYAPGMRPDRPSPPAYQPRPDDRRPPTPTFRPPERTFTPSPGLMETIREVAPAATPPPPVVVKMTLPTKPVSTIPAVEIPTQIAPPVATLPLEQEIKVPMRPPAYQVFGTVESTPKVQAEVHQPFKQLEKIVRETPPPERVVNQREATPAVGVPEARNSGRDQKQQERPKQTFTPKLPEGVSLTQLKSQPKKDKGPSEQNLSSLKEALMAVTRAQVAQASKSETPSLAQGDASLKRPTEAQSAQTTIQSAPTSEHETPPPQTPLPQAVPRRAPERPALLAEDIPTFAPREVPEDILRGVLAD